MSRRGSYQQSVVGQFRDHHLFLQFQRDADVAEVSIVISAIDIADGYVLGASRMNF